MAALSDQDRASLWAEIQHELSVQGLPIECLKAQGREVVNALDSWYESNVSAINLAIPQPQRGLLSQVTKAKIFFAVGKRRYDVGA